MCGPAYRQEDGGHQVTIRQLSLRSKGTTRTRLAAIVDALNLPFEWSLDEFVDAVTELRQRPIVLAPMPVNGTRVCGFWLARATDDLVLHPVSSDPARQKQIITHEVSHMLLKHPEDTTLEPAALANALSGVDPGHLAGGSIVRARGFTDYNEQGEYEAELMGRMIVTRASKVAPQPGERLRDRGLRLF